MTTPPPSNPTDEVIDQVVALAGLQHHPRNYKRHPADQIERLAASLRAFGQPRTIAVWRGIIIAGHGVAQAAQHLGWRQIRASIVPDNWSAERAQAYLVADNETQRGAISDAEALVALIKEVAGEVDIDAIGFAEQDLDTLMASLEPLPAILGVNDVVDKQDRAGDSPWSRVVPSATVRVLIGDIEFGVDADLAKAWADRMRQYTDMREAARQWLEQHMQS